MADVTIDIKKSDGTTLTFTKKYINSVKSLSQSTTDAGNVQYGTIANSGSIELADGDGYISSLIDDGTLPVSNLDVKVKLNGEVLQEHITTDSDYNTEDTSLSISMSNFIKDFDSLKYKGYLYTDASKTVYDLIYDVLYTYYYPQFPSETYPDFIDNMFDADLLTYIKDIEIEYPYIEYGVTYRQVLDNLCTLGQMNMFADEQNKPKFVSARPIYNNNDTITQLKWFDVVEPLKYTKTLKNKYDGVEMSKTNAYIDLDVNSLIQTYNSLDSTTRTTSHNSDYTPAGSTTYGYDAYVYVTYYNDTISISKKSEDNFSTVEKIMSGVDAQNNANIKHSVNYKYYTSTSITRAQVVVDSRPPVNITWNSGVEGSGEIATYGSFSASIGGTSASVNDETNLKITSVRQDANNWYIDYKIAVGVEYIKDAYYNDTVLSSSNAQKYVPISLEVSIYGNKRTIKFQEVSASTDDIENAKTKAYVNSSNLLQNTTTYNGTEIADIIKEDILTDYRRGIQTGSLSLNANKVDVGDLIRYPDDNRVWRVTGKNFNYDGSIEFPIEVMQCLIEYSEYGLFNENDENIYTWDYMKSHNLVALNNGEITSSSFSDTGILRLPEEVTSIGSNAFRNTNITSIYIPKTTTSISALGFSGTKKLTGIVIDAENTVYDSRDNCNAIIATSSNKLIVGCAGTTIPSTVTTLGSNSFIGSGPETLTIPNAVTSIETSAIYYSGLRKLVVGSSINSSVCYIANSAFQSNDLSELVFNSQTSLLGYIFNLPNLKRFEINNAIFNSYPNFQWLGNAEDNTGFDLIFDGNIATIPSRLFDIDGVSPDPQVKIKSIYIGESVTSIKSRAFIDSSHNVDYVHQYMQTITFENPNNWTNTYHTIGANFSDPVVNVQLLTNSMYQNNFASMEVIRNS